jgi:hypothetical protein
MGDRMSSEEPPPPAEEKAREATPSLAVPDEKPREPGEAWIEEYESEKKPKAPKKKKRHVLGIAILVIVLLSLVLWTVLSPQVLPEAGGTYIGSGSYANLGSYAGNVDIRWLFNLVHVANTTWGVSVSGDANVSSGQPATFHVLVTKVNEAVTNAWFVGTSVDLKSVELYTDDGALLGSMVSESSEPFGPMAEVEATFDSPGTYECQVHVEMTIYSKMVVGFLPVKVLRMTVHLDVDIVAS